MSQLKVNSIVPIGGLPSGASGGIIQVVQTVKTTTFSTSSTSYTDITGLSVSITPSSSSNKILVMMHVQIGHSSDVSAFLRLVRGSTAIAVGTDVSSRTACTVGMFDDPSDDECNSTSMMFLDSPATTSATTYKIQMTTEASGNTGTCFVNRSGEDADNNQCGRPVSAITVMEVTT